jgi:hypothetical protein
MDESQSFSGAVSSDVKRHLDGRWAAFLRDPSRALTLRQLKSRVARHRRKRAL